MHAACDGSSTMKGSRCQRRAWVRRIHVQPPLDKPRSRLVAVHKEEDEETNSSSSSGSGSSSTTTTTTTAKTTWEDGGEPRAHDGYRLDTWPMCAKLSFNTSLRTSLGGGGTPGWWFCMCSNRDPRWRYADVHVGAGHLYGRLSVCTNACAERTQARGG